MTAFLAGTAAPAATITTTGETLMANIPATQIQPPPDATAIIIRGRAAIATGASVTSLVFRLRAGQNNTTTAQVDVSDPVDAGASGSYGGEFEFEDTSVANIGTGGYSLTVVQTAATGNGTVTNVDYEADYVIP
jgi:hypothetical protein